MNSSDESECSHENVVFIFAFTLYVRIALTSYTYVKITALYVTNIFGF